MLHVNVVLDLWVVNIDRGLVSELGVARTLTVEFLATNINNLSLVVDEPLTYLHVEFLMYIVLVMFLLVLINKFSDFNHVIHKLLNHTS